MESLDKRYALQKEESNIRKIAGENEFKGNMETEEKLITDN